MRSKRFSIVSAIAEEHLKFYPISTQLRRRKSQNRETGRVEVFRNGRSRRDCFLFSIDTQFPKLDVAGSILPHERMASLASELAHVASDPIPAQHYTEIAK